MVDIGLISIKPIEERSDFNVVFNVVLADMATNCHEALFCTFPLKAKLRQFAKIKVHDLSFT